MLGMNCDLAQHFTCPGDSIPIFFIRNRVIANSGLSYCVPLQMRGERKSYLTMGGYL